MNALSLSLASAIMRAAQSSPFRGLGDDFGATDDQLAHTDPKQRFRQAYTEAAGVGDFYAIFPELPEALAGKDVLDFGCGYGGKAVEFAGHAKSVAGIEPVERHIVLANAYARHRGISNVEFRICPQDGIPFPDDSFDVVLSHDVIEHVSDPRDSLREIVRVLRPGGTALIAFPPYDGMLSHHLDYACTLPGLHLVFSPETLIETANREIARRKLQTAVQPPARLSWDGSRRVLPTLNGLTTAQFTELANHLFDKVDIQRRPVAKNRSGLQALVRGALNRVGAVVPWVREATTASLHCRLGKAQAGSQTAAEAPAADEWRQAGASAHGS
jgi:SAM-dependent methyltransferase